MKHPLEKIQPIAIGIWNDLKPHCKKIKIAGSIRRQVSECKDIEVVLSPNDRSARNKIGAYFMQHGKILKGKFTGRYIKCMYKGFPVDVFIPQEHDFYRQLAIRTGSSNYSKSIAMQWSKLGYIGTEEGLKHKSLNMEFEKAISFASEKHFFEFLEMDYLEPKNRH